MVKKHALLIGTREGAKWHPIDGVDLELTGILAGLSEIEVSTDHDHLAALETGAYQLLVCYADTWEEALTDAQISHLVRFVAGGGGLLVLHSGMSFQKRLEFQALVGAKFTGHPSAGELKFRMVAPEHPISVDVPTSWSMDEEPYRFTAIGETEATVLCEYHHDSAWHPAAWAQNFCRGRVVYLMPGHSLESFRQPAYRSLIRSAALWLLRRAPEPR